ncbi:hypothetical protein CBR_g22933 [Chara braunii]|uniref:Uncharacterized protein n=1 Tax=Chara braunii TaxID=69332 RepID=A0A388L3D3_CHABU|nr:hypothetical protein CBR_g22933 [Chara braunii]|eukprot:GBG76713.1 hypothetical protein CBR_g22933 [Chara braunii]
MEMNRDRQLLFRCNAARDRSISSESQMEFQEWRRDGIRVSDGEGDDGDGDGDGDGDDGDADEIKSRWEMEKVMEMMKMEMEKKSGNGEGDGEGEGVMEMAKETTTCLCATSLSAVSPKNTIDLILNGHIAKVEDKRRNMAKESEGILDKTTKLEETLKRIWEVAKDLGVDDTRVDGDGYDPALMGIMGEKEEELRQLLDNQPPAPPPPEGEGDEAGRNKRNGFVPISSAQWLEGRVRRQQDRGWVGSGFNNLAPIDIKGWKFLANISKSEVEKCQRKALAGTLDYANTTPHFGGPTSIRIVKPKIWEAQRSSVQPAVSIGNFAIADILTAQPQITIVVGVILTVECKGVAIGELRGFGTRTEEGIIICDVRLRGVSGDEAFPGKQTWLLWPTMRTTMGEVASSIAATLDHGEDIGGDCFYGFGGLFGPDSDYWAKILRIGDALFAEPRPRGPYTDGALVLTGSNIAYAANEASGGMAGESAGVHPEAVAHCSSAA